MHIEALLRALQDQLGDMSGASLKDTTWPVACTTGATAEHTLLRRPNVTRGISNDDAWAASMQSEWLVYPRGSYVTSSGAVVDVNTGGAS